MTCFTLVLIIRIYVDLSRDDSTGGRKRTYSSHLNAVDAWLFENKSRKTSSRIGSGMLDDNNPIPIIDLTEDDADDFSLMDQHAPNHPRRKEQDDADARFAQQFQQQQDNIIPLTEPDFTLSFPVQDFALPRHYVSIGDDAGFLPRTDQYAPNYRQRQEQEVTDARLAQQFQQRRDNIIPSAEPKFTLNLPVQNFSLPSRHASSDTHGWPIEPLVPSQGEAFLTTASSNVDRTFTNSPFNSHKMSQMPSHIRRPGFFPAHNDPIVESSSPFWTAPRMPSSFVKSEDFYGRPLPGAAAARGSDPDRYSDSIWARPFQALAMDSGRDDSPTDKSQTGSIAANFGPSIDSRASIPRHGYLVNGQPSYLNQGHSKKGTSLSDIINRTNNYDFSTGLDRQGNSIPEASMRVVQSLQEVQSSSFNDKSQDKDIHRLLANIGATTRVEDQADTPEAFHYPLYLHQKIALKWMQTMEADEGKKGGILADDMGLGKTISTLALIVTRPGPVVGRARHANVSRLNSFFLSSSNLSSL
jgi:hypothetical protein